MNDTIELQLRHRSIRKFTADPVNDEQLAAVIGAAQMASSSSNMQAYSVIAVDDPATKRELAVLAGNQAYIEQCPVFLVWCADLWRIQNAVAVSGAGRPEETSSAGADSPISVPSTVENFLVATVDTALAAQNAAIAAESIGLGIVYIGGIRNSPREISEVLKLPRLVYPVFGMCLGVPDQSPLKRPRLPLEAVLHRNKYEQGKSEAHIHSYDERMKQYMIERTAGQRSHTWSDDMKAKMSSPQRKHMRDFLLQQGFELT